MRRRTGGREELNGRTEGGKGTKWAREGGHEGRCANDGRGGVARRNVERERPRKARAQYIKYGGEGGGGGEGGDHSFSLEDVSDIPSSLAHMELLCAGGLITSETSTCSGRDNGAAIGAWQRRCDATLERAASPPNDTA